MTIIDADKFLSYLIFSKHIDGLTCGEVKEAIEMCKVDVVSEIRAEIEEYRDSLPWENNSLMKWDAINYILEQIIDKYKNKAESRGKE